jgi:hypothetical protein
MIKLVPESVTPIRLQVPNALNLVEILAKTKLTVRVTTSSCFHRNLTYLQHLRPFRFELKLRIQVAVICITLAAGLLPAMVNAGFPEFGFCPLGGPPGWFNRVTGQHDRYYYAPPRVMNSPWNTAQPSYGWPTVPPAYTTYPRPPVFPGY